MGSASNGSGQVISAPKGGGALHGIGENFSPDLFTGTGNFSVPISLPAGRNGFQPQLSLSYSTGHGNGLFGLGWNLAIPGVSRKTSDGVPRYDDQKDTFILSGSEDLVLVEGGAAAREYRPRTEGLFAKIVHLRSATTDHWEVRGKDGLMSCYGSPEAFGNDPATIVKPRSTSSIASFAWKLTRTEDLFGNQIEYLYQADEGAEASHKWKQPVLSEIRYVDYEDQNQQRDFLVHLSFEYEERLDPFSDYRAGFEIRTTKRCKAIAIAAHPKLSATPSPVAVRRYEFSYSNDSLNAS